MSVNLQKGQKVDLTKENPNLQHLMVGLGWDPISAQQSGFLKGVFGGAKRQIDCDASVLLLNENGKIQAKNDDIVYFGHLTHSTKAIRHMGDNLTGAGAGDDEQIFVDLSTLPPRYDKAVFVVNIYQSVQRSQHFGMIQNAFIRLINADTNEELCRYNLTEDYNGKTAMIMGEIYRHDGNWKFNAIGMGTTDPSLTELAAHYS
jgi:Uncharacterized proteins involved in stress response, homologs of TerZ and putative cAMP-binding protein CABP1